MKLKPITLWKIATFVLAALLVVSFIVPRGAKDGVQSEPEVELTLLNDPSCAQCDTTQIVSVLKSDVFTNLKVTEVDINSKKGKKLAESFGINIVPAYIFDSNVEKSSSFAKVSPALIKKDGQYLLNPEATGGSGKIIGEVKTSESDPVKGGKDAKVTIIEFTDFQCPFCGKFTTETLPKLNDEYLKTGKVKLVFKDLPLPFHDNAMNAHMAGKCAAEQDKFWQYHDKLFANQEKLQAEKLKEYAKELKLDTKKFNECLDSRKYEKEVQANAAMASSFGIGGTPSFIINGMTLVGAQPFEAFKQVIDAELAK